MYCLQGQEQQPSFDFKRAPRRHCCKHKRFPIFMLRYYAEGLAPRITTLEKLDREREYLRRGPEILAIVGRKRRASTSAILETVAERARHSPMNSDQMVRSSATHSLSIVLSPASSHSKASSSSTHSQGNATNPTGNTKALKRFERERTPLDRVVLGLDTQTR